MKAQSNWQKLHQKLSAEPKENKNSAGKKKGKDSLGKAAGELVRSRGGKSALPTDIDEQVVPQSVRDNYVAIDCEMVGLGPTGKKSALARCAVVDFDGAVLYDRFVRPKGYVTDFRTKYSGVRQQDLRQGEACLFEECQRDVSKLLKDKVLVGHALRNDTAVLMLSHPRSLIRDTAHYHPLMRKVGHETVKYRSRALKELSKQYLGVTIQDGEHDPSVDARTAMLLYRKFRTEWEKGLKNKKKHVVETYAESSAADAKSSASTEKVNSRKRAASSMLQGDDSVSHKAPRKNETVHRKRKKNA